MSFVVNFVFVNLVLINLVVVSLGEQKPSNCILQLANRSIRTAQGRIDYVLAKVNIGYFLINFVVLDIDLIHMCKKI